MGSGMTEAAKSKPTCCGCQCASKEGHIPDKPLSLSGKWSFADWLGAIKVRLDIGRMDYRATPGLYAAGNPDADSPVLVTANYKLSLDLLRHAIDGIDAWVLVLDTNGVNVWCAAGKGTFGTGELVSKVKSCRLKERVRHRTLVVPQLGAVGVAAHEVKRKSGFKVVYGPVRCSDIKAFLKAGMKADERMRRVEFKLPSRLLVAPVEAMSWLKHAVAAAFAMATLSFIINCGSSFDVGCWKAESALWIAGSCFLAGTFGTAALLPWLPGRAFSIKGAGLGLALSGVAMALGVLKPFAGIQGAMESGAWALLICSACSFIALNFTGSTTFTSMSGVKREMKFAIPIQSLAAAAGVALLIASGLIGGA